VQVETMEGAALHYVALQLNIPFLQVRSLSNFAGERDKKRWRMEEAIENLNKELERLLNKFL
jgi:futalosine hydrolase